MFDTETLRHHPALDAGRHRTPTLAREATPTYHPTDADVEMTVAAGGGALSTLDAQLDSLHATFVTIVDALHQVVATGICEQIEGLPVDHWLRLRAKMIGADAATLVTAAEVLPTMPVAYDWFRRGIISWGTARNLALKLARLSTPLRQTIDHRLGRTFRDWDGIDGWSANRLLDAIDRAIDELDGPDDVAKREQAEADASYVAVQPAFDGRVRGKFDLDPIYGATFLDGLNAATPDGPRSTRPNRRAQGLATMAAAYLAGTTGTCETARPAKPLLRIVVDINNLTATAAGHVLLRTPGGVVPTLSARLLDLLAADADIQAVLMDGHRPLAVSKKRKAEDTPQDVKVAIATRDVADRMPGSDRPIEHIHHLVHRDRGGDHHPDNLAGLSTASHTIVHDLDWTTTLDHDTGMFTIERDGRRWSAVPPTTQLSR